MGKTRLMKPWILVAFLFFLPVGIVGAKSIKKFGGSSIGNDVVTIWKVKGTAADTTAAASLTVSEWNRFTITQGKQNEEHDPKNEWFKSSLANNLELCFQPMDNTARKFKVRAWFSFKQDITAAQQAFYLGIGYSSDGELVVHGDVGTFFYNFTGMNDNTWTTVETEEVFTIADGGCIQPMVWPDTTVDLDTSSGAIVITRLAE